MKIKPERVQPEPGLEPGMHQGWGGLVGGPGAGHKATCAAHATLALLRQIDNGCLESHASGGKHMPSHDQCVMNNISV
jgi:hypothetical protein